MLEKGLQIRDALVHGFEAEPISKDLISQLILIAEELLRADEDDTETDKIEEAVDNLVAWFNENYEDPAEAVPYESAEGGYIYYAGGPYDPIEELSENFPDVDERLIKLAADKLYQTLPVWVRRGQYP